jgi:transcription elongation factor
MAQPAHRTPGTQGDAAVVRRDRALRHLRRATAIVAVTAAVSVGGVTALAAATRPGHTSASAPPPAAAPERSAPALEPPPAAPESIGSDDDAQGPTASDPVAPSSQPQQPAPPPLPPVTSGGS